MEAILGELNEYAKEVTMLIERAKNLKDKAKSTAQLVRLNFPCWYWDLANSPELSDLLSYEENVALKELATETQVESRSMCQFTVNTST